MAKDYNSKRPQTKARRTSISPLLLIVLAFLGGYFVANTVDFNRVNQWLEKNVLAEKHDKPMPAAKPKPQDTAGPKFEFYTLLSRDSNGVIHKKQPPAPTPAAPVQPPAVTRTPQNPPAIAAASAPAATKTPAPVTSSKPITKSAASAEYYVIQIAAYNKRQDAERLKAAYVLKGYDVSIRAFRNNQNTEFYRVVLGPFSSKTAAEKAQGAIARGEHINGILRRAEA